MRAQSSYKQITTTSIRLENAKYNPRGLTNIIKTTKIRI